MKLLWKQVNNSQFKLSKQMRQLRIAPKEWISEKFVQDFYGYSKKEALKIYRKKFPQFTVRELRFID